MGGGVSFTFERRGGRGGGKGGGGEGAEIFFSPVFDYELGGFCGFGSDFFFFFFFFGEKGFCCINDIIDTIDTILYFMERATNLF